MRPLPEGFRGVLRACAVRLGEQADGLQTRGLGNAARVGVDLDDGLPLTVRAGEVVDVVTGVGAVVAPGSATRGRVADQTEAITLPGDVDALLGMCRLHREEQPRREQTPGKE